MNRMCHVDPRFANLERLLRDEVADDVRFQIQSHVDGCEICAAERPAILADRKLLAAAVAEPPTIHAARAHEITGSARRIEVRRFRAAVVVFSLLAFGAVGGFLSGTWVGGTGTERVRQVGDSLVSLEGGSSARFTGHSHARVVESDGGVRIRLDRGEVECRVRPLRPGQSFVVATTDLEVRVHGTHFVVRASSPRSEVSVIEGRVEVRRRGEAPAFLVPPVVPRAEAPNASVPVAAPVPVPETPPRPAAPAPDLLPEARRALASRDYAGAEALLGRHLSLRPRDDDARYLLGEAQRLGGDADAATATFESLASGRGRIAENALARLAFLAERRGSAAAVTAWDRYLAAYPRGTVAAEGTIRRANTLFSLGRRAEARAALERFLMEFPDHPRRAEVEERLGASH